MGGEWQFCDYDFGGSDFPMEAPMERASDPYPDRDNQTSEPAKMHQFTSGAKSTVVKPRYDLIPQIALELLAERFGYGAERHGEGNYLKGANDPVFLRDRKNHLFEHVVQFAKYGRRSDLAAILCNAAILAECGAFKDDRTEKR